MRVSQSRNAKLISFGRSQTSQCGQDRALANFPQRRRSSLEFAGSRCHFRAPPLRSVLTWCLRIVAAVLAAAGATLAVVAVESDWSLVDTATAPIEHSGIAAAAFSIFLIGCAAAALVISSPRRKYSAEVRLITALLALICVGAVAIRYASRGAQLPNPEASPAARTRRALEAG